jgi:hypothetical protein
LVVGFQESSHGQQKECSEGVGVASWERAGRLEYVVLRLAAAIHSREQGVSDRQGHRFQGTRIVNLFGGGRQLAKGVFRLAQVGAESFL